MSPELRAAYEAVAAAWMIPGRSPVDHYMEQIRLNSNWPTLAKALMRLEIELGVAARLAEKNDQGEKP